MSFSTPAPVSAEPKKTGWICPALACAARSSSGEPKDAKVAARVPRLPADPIGTTAGVRRFSIAWSVRSTSAPPRSILFTNSSVGTPSRCSARIRIRVCGCTPSTAETTSTAPSSTLSARSTSAMKSGWPGVSIRLTVTSSSANDTTADLIVMPRCCSSASESVCVVPASTLPGLSITPAAYSSRSVSVVLPASTCARIPKLSVLRSDKRHTLQIGHKGPLDWHERCAQLPLLGGRRRPQSKAHETGRSTCRRTARHSCT